MFLTALLTSGVWYFMRIIYELPKTPIYLAEETVVEAPAFHAGPPTLNEPVLQNGCYVASSAYKDMIKARDLIAKRQHWAKIMRVNIVETTGHAVCVFHYDGEWHCYDNLHGTYRLGKYLTDPSPQDIAKRISPKYKDAEWLTTDPSK